MNPGDLLRNRYRIEKALAAGGFGETYLAVDLDYPGQPEVVVKHLKPQQSDPQALEIARRLFESEAGVLAELGKSSDRIPTLHAYFEEKGEFYLVQEFIAGQTLTKELANKKLLESETIGILREILVGLREVHGKNKIHRDLKPDNIMRRSSDGKLVLIDFGTVKDVRRTTNLSLNPLSVTVAIGTDGYMAPEQGIGRPRLASDVYAVGAIGIQCLTGQYPHQLFDDDTNKFVWLHLCQVSQGLAAVLEKMVAYQANERYGNAIKAMEAIDQLLVARQPPMNPSPAAPNQQSPAPTQKAYVPPVQLAVQTVKVKTQPVGCVASANANSRGRRNFLKWLSFGGVGVFGVVALSQLVKNSSIPPLTKIQFTSVKLDSYGKIVDRPAGQAEIFSENIGNGISLTMIKIPAGKFMMGQTASEKQELLKFLKYHADGFFVSELPQHQVKVPEFFLGQTLVTQTQWQEIMGNNPSGFKGDSKLPVDSVTRLDAMDFCQKLSQKTGRIYRLPSEAEWEYACRAGTTTPFHFGETITPEVVNYDGSKTFYASADKGENRGKPTPVGIFPSNGFGLYDMHGNLWEWCLDEWKVNYNNAPVDGSARGNINSRDKGRLFLLRGGSWNFDPVNCRSTSRNRSFTDTHSKYWGFRVVYSPWRTS
jgi:eukaryotic-like serine/threonine-protein kinase